IDFSKLGGFPGNQNMLDFMQKSYREAITGLSKLAGDKVIVSGCVVTGSQISEGWVVIDGELLPFKSGAIGNNVIVEEIADDVLFQDGSSQTVYYTKRAKFGTGSPQYSWASFVRLDTILALQNNMNTLSDSLNNL